MVCRNLPIHLDPNLAVSKKVYEVVGVMGVFQCQILCGGSVVCVLLHLVVLGVVQATPVFSIVWRVSLVLFPNH